MDGRHARMANKVAASAMVLLAVVAEGLTLGARTAAAAAATPGGLTPVRPARVLDTRGPQGPCLTGARDVVVVGVPGSGVPADAAAVVLNVTAVDARVPGYLTVWPAGSTRPTASVLGYPVREAIANNATVPVGVGGKVSLYASGGCPQVVLDVTGFHTTGPSGPGGFTGVTPARVLDTRQPGSGPCLVGGRTLVVGGAPGSGIPSDAAAVALDVTVTDQQGPGFLSLSPGARTHTSTSTLNYVAGAVVANGASVRLVQGMLTVEATGGCPNVVVDVTGWYAPGAPVAEGGLVGVSPTRLLDTRTSGTCLARSRSLLIAGVGVVPADAAAVALNVTAVGAAADGFVTVYPSGEAQPLASSLNYERDEAVPNGVTAKLGADGRVVLFANEGCPHVVVDLVGVYVRVGNPPAPLGPVVQHAASTPRFGELADPSVMVDGGWYYLFASATGTHRLPVRRVMSIDAPLTGSAWLAAAVDAMPAVPAWATRDVLWAPSVVHLADRYVMYFAANRIGAPDPNNQQCVGRAFSTNPMGPYQPESTPFSCGLDGRRGALDPYVMRAPDGSLWLYAAFSDTETPLHVIPLDANGDAPRRPDGQAQYVAAPVLGKQYAWEGRFIENPAMVYDPQTGTYVLSYSAGDWWTAGYSTGVARCTSPIGLCTSNAAGPWLASGSGRTGAGGLAFFTDLGGAVRAAYATFPGGLEGWLTPRSGSLAHVTLGPAPALAD